MVIEKSSQRRKHRDKLTEDGKLTILACGHPARRVTKSGNEPVRMGNRHEYLARILRVATKPEFDGVMATTDIIEDLLILDQLLTPPATADGSSEPGKSTFLPTSAPPTFWDAAIHVVSYPNPV